MDGHVVLTGMVLTAMPVGEYDKRITILTTERGKITAFARGSRRPNSQLLASTNPFCFGEFELVEGRSAYTLVKTSIKNYFRELTADPAAAYTGFYFMEFASWFCQENNDEREMLKLLYQSLRALISPHFRNELVRGIFECKALYINGEGLQLNRCIACGKKENPDGKALNFLSLSRGGLLCDSCSSKYPGFPVSGTVLYTLRYIEAAKIEKLYSFSLTDQALEEFLRISRQYVKTYVRHDFHSLEILDSLAFNA